jgi:chromosome segregation ATPase
MEFEQIIKRIDLLEKQSRKDRDAAESLQKRLDAMETSLDALLKQMKTLSKDVAEISATSKRLNQFDEMFSRQRNDAVAAIADVEKKAQKREKDIADRLQVQIEKFQKGLEDVRKQADTSDIRKQLKDKSTEEIRITQSLADLKSQVESVSEVNDAIQRAQKASDEVRRQDVKRVADMGGDVAALRKRLDETRDKMQLNIDALRNVENRMNELLASESERKQSQGVFIEQQTRAQIERDRAMKEWNARVDEFKKQASTLDSQLHAAEDVTKAAKRAQDSYTDLNQKLERRVNEVTEMQRLAEDRARQEWTAFKADDQKRWTSLTLTQDETLRELRGAMQAAVSRVDAMEEAAQSVQDQLHQTTETTERQLQELMNWAHEWLTGYERIMGHGKTTKKSSKGK